MTASVKTPTKRRRAKTFADGFVMGLAAPSLLVSGFLSECRSQVLKSGVGDDWQDVGQFIRDGADAYRKSRPGDRTKRRA